jgi:hypothetical protein
VVDYETFSRLPLKPGQTIKSHAIRAGVKQNFMIRYIDEFGNFTSLTDKIFNVEITEKSGFTEITDMQIVNHSDQLK